MTELVTRNTDRPKRDKVRMVADDIVTANFVTRGRVHKGQTNGLGLVEAYFLVGRRHLVIRHDHLTDRKNQ